HEVVPVRDDVPERAALVTERDAAIHAARALRAQDLRGRLLLELAPVLQALLDRLLVDLLARDLEESGDLAHWFLTPRRVARRPCRGAPSRAPSGTPTASPSRAASGCRASPREAATRPASACSRSGAG